MKMGKNTQRTRVILVLGALLVIFGLYWTLTSDSTSPSSTPTSSSASLIHRAASSEDDDELINRRIEAKRKQHEEELKKRKDEIEADSKRRKVEEQEKKKVEEQEEEDLTAYKRILKETIDVRWKLPSSIKRPNFVIFLADDLGWGDVGCYGADFKTPNLDSLASSGVKFQQWYSAAPVCSPSRAALLTGRYPQKTGITQILEGGRDRIAGLPRDEVTLAKALKSLGYRTGLFGKWHLGSVPDCKPQAHGFDDFYGFHSGALDYYSHTYYWLANAEHDLWRNTTETFRNGEYLTDIITSETIRFISSGQHKPFFAFVSYNAPHWPLHAPKRFFDANRHLPEDRRAIAALMASMDEGIGQVIDSLKQNGLYEDTFILFTGDNGPSSEYRNNMDGREVSFSGVSAGGLKGYKYSLFEGGIREPAIVSYPRLLKKKGVVVEKEVVTSMDIFPTFVRLAGGEVASNVDGKDILPLLMRESGGEAKGDNGTEAEGETKSISRKQEEAGSGKKTQSESEGDKKSKEEEAEELLAFAKQFSESLGPHEGSPIFWEYMGQMAVRLGDWKLVLNGQANFFDTRYFDERVFLSDMKNDKEEKINLVRTHPLVVKWLSTLVKDWYDKIRKNSPTIMFGGW